MLWQLLGPVTIFVIDVFQHNPMLHMRRRSSRRLMYQFENTTGDELNEESIGVIVSIQVGVQDDSVTPTFIRRKPPLEIRV